MTLEHILQAAVNSLSQGKRSPHSFHAFVQDKGYVNDGSKVYDQADYVRQAVRSAQSEVDNMGYAPSYAERGYTQPAKGILMANWNHFPRGLDSTLERAGYAIEWSDEWTTCDDCNQAIRTQPDGYDWKPAYRVDDNGIVCSACAKDSELADDDEDLGCK